MATKEIPAAELKLGDHIVEPADLEGYIAEVKWLGQDLWVGYTDRTKALIGAQEPVTIEDHT